MEKYLYIQEHFGTVVRVKEKELKYLLKYSLRGGRKYPLGLGLYFKIKENKGDSESWVLW